MEITPIMLLLFSFIIGTLAKNDCCEDYCFTKDNIRPQLSQLGSKTPYNKNNLEANANFKIPNCTPVKFWMLSRHGIQLPSAEELKAVKILMDEEYPEKIVIENYLHLETNPSKGALCDGDLDLIHDWRWDHNITEQFASTLTVNGWNELKDLGIRFQKTFPDLFTKNYNEDRFVFGNTDEQTTKKSNEAFVEGLFGAGVKVNFKAQLAKLLQPFKYCPEFINNRDKLSHENSEVSKFKRSYVYQDLISDVSTKLGFNQGLNESVVEKMYEMCRYDNARNSHKPSPWCSVFTAAQINVMEFKEDLLSYYEAGYGFSLNSKISCALIADMLNHLERNDKISPHVVAYFSDSTTIETFLTSLGAFKDKLPIVAENFKNSKRKWRTSLIVPFAANIVAVKYHCPTENVNYKTMMFLNEKPIELEECKDGVCEWETFKKKYSEFQNTNCSKIFCHSTSTEISSGNIVLVSIYLMAINILYFLF